eukprot:TRINITY_DN90884_c0_g1_i1.p1 TRINITY_DN90884_c0_g1~~TRINITY_DN90884_c0_g1_i1.p1  ORF type:complete len:558 (+),score=113.30 TRINITY_DN90884_c0_g1_i1:131-1804(+)
MAAALCSSDDPADGDYDSYIRTAELRGLDYDALKTGSVENLRALLARGASAAFFEATPRCPSALEQAAAEKEGAAIVRDPLTPLHAAAKWNRLEACDVLLQHGANIEATAAHGETPLHMASYFGQPEAVELLLRRKADVLSVTREGQSTALHLGAQMGHAAVCRALVAAQAAVNALDKDGYSPLLCASLGAYSGTPDVCSLLVSAKASVAACSGGPAASTPLHVAAGSGNERVCSVLLDAGADAAAVNGVGYQPLAIATASQKLQVCELLLGRGAEVNSRNGGDGVTPLYISVAKQSSQQEEGLPICQLLLRHRADANARTSTGATALHIAAQEGMRVAVGLLMHGRADVLVRRKDGTTPLHLAANGGHHDICKVLLNAHANAAEADSDGLTPLHGAAMQWQPKLCALLLRKRADPRAPALLPGAGGKAVTPVQAAALLAAGKKAGEAGFDQARLTQTLEVLGLEEDQGLDEAAADDLEEEASKTRLRRRLGYHKKLDPKEFTEENEAMRCAKFLDPPSVNKWYSIFGRFILTVLIAIGCTLWHYEPEKLNLLLQGG